LRKKAILFGNSCSTGISSISQNRIFSSTGLYMERPKININKDLKLYAKNSIFVLLIFWTIILFQLTVIKNIWGIESLSRIFNLSMTLILTIYAFNAISTQGYNRNVWYFHIFPGLLIFFGLLINIVLNVIENPTVFGYFSYLIPWVAFLSIPALIKTNSMNSEVLWRYFYYFMLITNILGIFEYFFVFSGIINFKILEIPNGIFLNGWFSILHMLSNGTPHYRYYGCFGESGDLAMWLLPAISYSFFYKKILGLLVFLLGCYLTDSLGGFISLSILIMIFAFISLNKRIKNIIFSFIFITIILLALGLKFGTSLQSKFEEKGDSRIIRVDNFLNTMNNFSDIIINNPIGFHLYEKTESMKTNNFFYGSNFTLGNMLQIGGISAFLGYTIYLILSISIALLSILRRKLSLEEKVVFSSLIVLLPFIFQRMTAWDSALYALLFAPSIIRILMKNNQINFNETTHPIF